VVRSGFGDERDARGRIECVKAQGPGENGVLRS